MSRMCACAPGAECNPNGFAWTHPGFAWSTLLEEIEREREDPYGTGDIVPADLWGRLRD